MSGVGLDPAGWALSGILLMRSGLCHAERSASDAKDPGYELVWPAR